MDTQQELKDFFFFFAKDLIIFSLQFPLFGMIFKLLFTNSGDFQYQSESPESGFGKGLADSLIKLPDRATEETEKGKGRGRRGEGRD